MTTDKLLYHVGGALTAILTLGMAFPWWEPKPRVVAHCSMSRLMRRLGERELQFRRTRTVSVEALEILAEYDRRYPHWRTWASGRTIATFKDLMKAYHDYRASVAPESTVSEVPPEPQAAAGSG